MLTTSSSPNALIVDDNIDNRVIFRTALEAVGIMVTDFGDPNQGLQDLEHNTYEVLLLDLQMPRLSGHEFLKRIRGISAHDSMKVVVITAHPHLAEGDVNDRADFVMLKPVSPIELMTFVKRIVGSIELRSTAESASRFVSGYKTR